MSGFLIFISMVTGTASFIALFRPLPRIGLPTRKRAAVVWAASWVLVVIGGALAPEPTPEELADRAEAEPEAECLEVIEADLVEFLPATHAVLVQFDLNSPGGTASSRALPVFAWVDPRVSGWRPMADL